MDLYVCKHFWIIQSFAAEAGPVCCAVPCGTVWWLHVTIVYRTVSCTHYNRPSEVRNACWTFTGPSLCYVAQRPPIKCIPQVRPFAQREFSLRHLAHPSPNFYRGSKSTKSVLSIFDARERAFEPILIAKRSSKRYQSAGLGWVDRKTPSPRCPAKNYDKYYLSWMVPLAKDCRFWLKAYFGSLNLTASLH